MLKYAKQPHLSRKTLWSCSLCNRMRHLEQQGITFGILHLVFTIEWPKITCRCTTGHTQCDRYTNNKSENIWTFVVERTQRNLSPHCKTTRTFILQVWIGTWASYVLISFTSILVYRMLTAQLVPSFSKHFKFKWPSKLRLLRWLVLWNKRQEIPYQGGDAVVWSRMDK